MKRKQGWKRASATLLAAVLAVSAGMSGLSAHAEEPGAASSAQLEAESAGQQDNGLDGLTLEWEPIPAAESEPVPAEQEKATPAPESGNNAQPEQTNENANTGTAGEQAADKETTGTDSGAQGGQSGTGDAGQNGSQSGTGDAGQNGGQSGTDSSVTTPENAGNVTSGKSEETTGSATSNTTNETTDTAATGKTNEAAGGATSGTTNEAVDGATSGKTGEAADGATSGKTGEAADEATSGKTDGKQDGDPAEKTVIAEVKALAETVASQTVTFGTAQESLHLPQELAAVDENGGEQTLAVQWAAEPAYEAEPEELKVKEAAGAGETDAVAAQEAGADGETQAASVASEKKFIFSASLTDEAAAQYALADGVALPQITVTMTAQETQIEKPMTGSQEREFTASADGVTVRAYAKKGVFSDNVRMTVSELGSDNAEVANALDNGGVDYDGFLAYDISFYDGDQKVEPKDGDVRVTFEVSADKLPEEADTASLTVQHLEESNGSTTPVTVADAANQTSGSVTVKSGEMQSGEVVAAQFSVGSFSTFAITWQWGWADPYFNITVHYVDENGREIQGNQTKAVDLSHGETIDFSSYKADGYDYVSAEYASGNGRKPVTGLQTKRSGPVWNFQYQVTFVNGKEAVETLTSDGTTKTADVYLIFRKGSYSVDFYQNSYNLGWEQNSFYREASLQEQTDAQGNRFVTVPLSAATAALREQLDIAPGTPITMQRGETTYTFYGWAAKYDANQDSLSEKYPAEGEALIPVGKFDGSRLKLYAVWSYQGGSGNKDVSFFIRLDGTIPVEPSDNQASKYSKAITKNDALKEYRHIYNNTQAVKNNIKTEPSAEEIKEALKNAGQNYDPETQYIEWYVIKFANDGDNTQSWHVDGALREKAKWTLTYNSNTEDTVANIIPGQQYVTDKGATVRNTYTAQGYSSTPPVRIGYTFTGWNTKPDGSGTSYKDGDSIGPLAAGVEVILYAQWSRNEKKVTVTKTVEGNMSDPTAQFVFSYTITEEGKAPVTGNFELTDGGSHPIAVPENASLTVEETGADGYETTFAVTPQTEGTENPQTGTSCTIASVRENMTIAFTNSRSFAPPTGIFGDAVPFAAMVLTALAAMAALGACCLYGRRR